MIETRGNVHRRLQKVRGRAIEYMCTCGQPAQEWAFQHPTAAVVLFDEKGSPYSTNLDDYVPLCQVCHRNLDADSYRANGRVRGKHAGAVLAARVASDPEFRDTITDRVRGHHQKMRTDPAIKAVYQQSMGATNARALPCSCGRSFNPGNLARHVRATGHKEVRPNV